MNTRLITSASGVLLAAAFATAEDAPKLVPRPVPGLFDALHAEKNSNEDALALLNAAVNNKPAPPIKESELPPADSTSSGDRSPGAGAAATYQSSPSAGSPATEPVAKARIVFIHRRATLPPQMTADLAKPAEAKGQKAVGAQVVPARPGKIRIIPKSEVAALLAPAPPPPKPAAP